MRGSTPPQLLLLCVGCVVAATASLPQTPAPSRQLCAHLRENEGEVLGITSYDDLLAVASGSSIALFSVLQGSQQCRPSDRFDLPSRVERFVELRLLNQTTLFYCDSQRCLACRKEPLSKWPCKEYDVHALGKDSGDILYAVSTMNREEIAIRAVMSRGIAAIMIFDENGVTLDESFGPVQTATDVSYITAHRPVLAYSRGRHSFFVSSSNQPHEPSINAKLGNFNRTMVKLSRVCHDDKTSLLESRIDIALTCGGINEDQVGEVGAAFYDEKSKKLYVSFSNLTNPGAYLICAFDQDKLERRFEQTWNLCQNTSYSRAVEDCPYTFSGPIPDNCYIFTRMGDAHRMLACSRFGGPDMKRGLDNCKLDEQVSTAYRFGWLENYQPIEGLLLAKVSKADPHLTMMQLEKKSEAFFFASTDMRISRAAADLQGLQIEAIRPPTFTAAFGPPNRFPFARVSDEGFFFVDASRVEFSVISCTALFKSCDDLARGGFADPLGCAFCPNEFGGGKVISRSDRDSCSKPLLASCPPILENAYQHPEYKDEWVVIGKGLGNLEKSKVLVCNQTCSIAKDRSDEKLTCKLGSSAVLDRNCDVKLIGNLERHVNFISQPKAMVETGTQTEQSNNNPSHTMDKAWKVVIAVVAVLLIIGIFAILIFIIRPRLMNRRNKDEGSMGIPFETVSYPRNPARNTYMCTDPSGFSAVSHYLSPYEKLFKDIDERLKIPESELFLESQIGKGHFGVVYKCRYTPPGEPDREVACKTLSGNSGVAEFINEGLVMDRFEHPRVMSLIGISVREDQIPMIVTDYMSKGDLAKYLRSETNRPTLRHLLNFCIEIAEGMAYLHENKFIHRDLAARNCMLDKDEHIKIADFGLCREVTNMEYSPIHRGRDLPLRWMAPEALESEQFTMQGDVWAYGVVLWEIMTRGMMPYQSLKSYLVLEFLKAGNRLGQPLFCPDLLFEVIMDCWEEQPFKRPAFSTLPDRIHDIIITLEGGNRRSQLYSPYEQSNSVRNSRTATGSTLGTANGSLVTAEAADGR